MTSEVKELVERLQGLLASDDLGFAECTLAEQWHQALTEAADTLQSQDRRIGELTSTLMEMRVYVFAALEHSFEERANALQIIDAALTPSAEQERE